MANDRISDLTAIASLLGTELMEVSQPTGGSPPYQSRKALLAQILAYLRSQGAGFMMGLDGEPGEDGPPGPPGTSSGGGGGTTNNYYEIGNITPDTHPASPTARDDEFEGTSLAGKWTWLNQQTASVSFAGGLCEFAACNNVGINISAITQAIPTPGSPWAFVCKVADMIAPNGPSCGLVLVGNTGKILLFGLGDTSSGVQLVIQRFNSASSFNGTQYTNSAFSHFPPNGSIFGTLTPLYLEISYDGTNINCNVSVTGAIGTFVNIYSETLAAWIGTAASIGIGGDGNSTVQSYYYYDWFRDYTNGYTPLAPIALQNLTNLSPDTHPASPTQWDDEFEEGALSAQWTARNLGAGTLTLSRGWLEFVADTTGGINHNALTESISGLTTWEFRAKIIAHNGLNAAASSGHGLILRNSVNGKYITFGVYASSTTQFSLVVQHEDTLTSGETNVLLGAAVPSAMQLGPLDTQVLYLRLVCDGTNYKYSGSMTGLDNTFVQFYTETVTNYLGVATDIGITVNNAVAGAGTYGAASTLCDWIRRVA